MGAGKGGRESSEGRLLRTRRAALPAELCVGHEEVAALTRLDLARLRRAAAADKAPRRKRAKQLPHASRQTQLHNEVMQTCCAQGANTPDLGSSGSSG